MKQNYDDKELDGLFRDKLAGEEATPREMVWGKIEKQLNGVPAKPIAWVWWLSGIILILGIGTWIGISKFSTADKIASQNTISTLNGGFDKVPYSSNGGDTGLITIEGGSYTSNNTDSLNASTNNSDQSTKNISSNSISSNNTSASKNNSISNLSDPKNVGVTNKNSNHKKPSLAKSDSKSASLYSDQSSFEKNHQPTKSSGLKIKNSDNSAKKPVASTDGKETFGETHEGSTYSLPKKLGEFNKSGDTIKTNSIVLVSDNPKTDSLIIPEAIPDSLPMNNIVVIADTTKPLHSDSLNKSAIDIPIQNELSKFYFALHGTVDQGKIISSSEYIDDLEYTDVAVYNESELKNLPQQTYSYGARFGWFLTNRISVTTGLYYSIFQSAPSEGHFKFNHNFSYDFNMHSPTSSVICKSSNFDFYDSNNYQSDTLYVNIKSEERYDYANIQLGISYYAIRKKHFGLYGNILSNGAYLAKQHMTLIVPKSGKTFEYGAEKMSGMTKFILGGQFGIGAEYIFGKHIGIWAEPSFYFSGILNKTNAVNLRPGGMRYLVGCSYHF